MPTITLFEHSEKAFHFHDRDIDAINRINRGDEILRLTRNGLQATQYVGVVRFGGHTVQILPKMYWEEAEPEALRVRNATRNLLYLLNYAGHLSIQEQEVAPLLRQSSDWFELLTRLFAVHLQSAWRRGAIRNYQTCEDHLPVMRGKWRIGEQLRHPERKHLFAVAYDEFTTDNPLNRILRFVVERLYQLTGDADNRCLLGELRHSLEDVTLLASLSAEEAYRPQLTRLHRQYEPLLNLARLFLDGGALQLAGGNTTTFAFVFDMNQLFEMFVVNFIRRFRNKILPSSLQSCELQPQSQGTWFHLAHSNESKPVFRLKPDLVFREGDTFPLLLDAKYKRLNLADRKLGISESDFYQMHVYAHRYHCPRVLLLYPQMADSATISHQRFTLQHDANKTIEAATIDLRLDLVQFQQ